MNILSAAVSHYRSTFSILFLIVLVGLFSRANMPLEADPDVSVPIVFVQVTLEGASPEDAARLLLRPLEKELRTLEGLDEIIATARESIAYTVVKFETEVDMNKALLDVREAVDRAKAEFPNDTDEPQVKEISASDYPAIVVTLAGEGIQERELFKAAQLLKRNIEAIPDVLSANMAGHREEVIEALIDPARLEHYGITSDDLIAAVLGNNLLVPAGELETEHGRFSVKVPGLIETATDVYGLPVKSTPEGVVTLGDVTDIRRTFKDPSRFTSVNGQRAITIEVRNRSGSNVIDVTRAVRALVDAERRHLPATIAVGYVLDQSEFSLGMVNEMQGNIVTAMALVMVIVIGAMGFRSGVLVGAAVPFSLLFAGIFIHLLDYSFNNMVMFGMLLALGMLIDGAIVITEFADRKMAEGMSSQAAYQISVKRMFWPVTASTATTLAAFLPIMFWPGVAGDFMSYLPVTVFAVLSGSLLYALFFAPVIGSLMGKSRMEPQVRSYLKQLEYDPPESLSGATGVYARLLSAVVRKPLLSVLTSLTVLVAIFFLFGRFNAGVGFFTDTEQKYGIVTVRAQGNLSVSETRDLVQLVERRTLQVDGVNVTYAASGAGALADSSDRAKDQIGAILVELRDPEELGRSTRAVFAEIRESTADIPGIIVNAKAFEGGPPVGKPVQIQLESDDYDSLLQATRHLRDQLSEMPGLRDVWDSSPLPGIEWELVVDRGLAAQMGANVAEVGRAVQLVTNGVKVGEYRPDDADDEVDIRVRYPVEARGIQALDYVRVNTPNGSLPISSFVTREAKPKVDKVQRVDGVPVMNVKADVEEGILADDMVNTLQQWIKDNPLDPAVNVVFRGANEEQQKSAAFLSVAFSLALFLMFVLLVTQFNSFYQGLVILSSVIMSTAGVLLGLLLTQSIFSVILTGVGIVALAGIVVNNNIVLIDTYNHVRQLHCDMPRSEAVVRACVQRLRPVFLTTATTVLGLLPMALSLSVDLIGRHIDARGVIASFWSPLASAIVYGLVFSSLLTLVVTPVLLLVPERLLQLVNVYLAPLFRRWQPVRRRQEASGDVSEL